MTFRKWVFTLVALGMLGPVIVGLATLAVNRPVFIAWLGTYELTVALLLIVSLPFVLVSVVRRTREESLAAKRRVELGLPTAPRDRTFRWGNRIDDFEGATTKSTLAAIGVAVLVLFAIAVGVYFLERW